MDLTFAGIIAVGLLFLDGLIFGVAAKKGVASILLVIVGLIIAGSIGLVIPFFNLSNVLAIVKGFVSSVTGMFPQMVYAFPILWLIGFALGVLV